MRTVATFIVSIMDSLELKNKIKKNGHKMKNSKFSERFKICPTISIMEKKNSNINT